MDSHVANLLGNLKRQHRLLQPRPLPPLLLLGLRMAPPPQYVHHPTPISPSPSLTPLPPSAVVEASHQLLFDLHSRIGLNLAVLIIWSVVNTLLFAPACYLMRWEQMKAKQTEARKEKDWLDAMSRQRSRIGVLK